MRKIDACIFCGRPPARLGLWRPPPETLLAMGFPPRVKKAFLYALCSRHRRNMRDVEAVIIAVTRRMRDFTPERN